MINIRRQVFETNSSSTHSISIAGGTAGLLDTIVPKDGVIHLTGGEFGWEWEKYNDALTKANYAAQFAFNDPQMTDMLIEVIKEHTGAKDVFITAGIGHIDHQSAKSEGGKAQAAFDTPAQLKNWIFNPSSWLFTGNDNENHPPNFYDVEFGIEYKYELCVDGIEITEQFQERPNKEELINSLSRIIEMHPLNARSYNIYPNKGYDLIYRPDKSVDKKNVYSFSNIGKKFVTLYKFDYVYTPKTRKFKGIKITDSVDINFKLKKI